MHRLGQKKPVEIVRMVVKDTLEERIVELQKKKRNMIDSALSRYTKTPDQIKKEKIKDLKLLFK